MDLQSENQSLRLENLFLKAKLDELEELIRHLHRGRFAAKSEAIDHPGMKGLFEDDKIATDNQSSKPKDTEIKTHTRKTTRKPIPEHLPRIDIPCLINEEEKSCKCCGKQMVKINEKTSEKIHIEPRKPVVHRYIMPVFSCKDCETIKQAGLPAHPLAKAGVTLETLAHIIVNKYSLGLPLFRQEKDFLLDKIEIG